MAYNPADFELVEAPTGSAPPYNPADFELVEPPPSSGIMRQAADIPVNIGSGVITGLKSLTDLAGADNAASQTLAGYQKFYQDALSPEAKTDQQTIAAIMKDAQDKGIMAQVGAGARAFTVAPIDTIAQAAGTMAPVIATGVAGKAVGLGAKGIQAAQVALGAGMGAGTIKGSIYQNTKQYLLEQGVDAATAEKAATEAQSYGGGNLDQILLGAGLGAAATGIGVERIIGKAIGGGVRDASKNIVTAGIKGAVQEGVPEAAQGGQEQMAQNLALMRLGYNVPMMRGVVSQGTLEGMAGMAAGGPVGIADYYQTPGYTQQRQAAMSAAGPAAFTPTPAVDPAIVAQEFGDVASEQQPPIVTDPPQAEQPQGPPISVGPLAQPAAESSATVSQPEVTDAAAGQPVAATVQPSPQLSPASENAGGGELTSAEKFDEELKRERAEAVRAARLLPIAEQPFAIWARTHAATTLGAGFDELSFAEKQDLKQQWNNARDAAVARKQPVYAGDMDTAPNGYVQDGDKYVYQQPAPASAVSGGAVEGDAPAFVAIYGGKEVAVDTLRGAMWRVSDNLKSGEHGYVRERGGQLYEVAPDTKMAVKVDAMRTPLERQAAKMEARIASSSSAAERASLTARLEELRSSPPQQPAPIKEAPPATTPAAATKKVSKEVATAKIDQSKPVPRAIKDGVIGQLDEAIADVEQNGEDAKARVTVSIPGDGTFTINKTKDALEDAKRRLSKLSAPISARADIGNVTSRETNQEIENYATQLEIALGTDGAIQNQQEQLKQAGEKSKLGNAAARTIAVLETRARLAPTPAPANPKTRLKRNLKPNSGAADATILLDLVEYGKAFYQKGMTLGKWSAQMVAEFGQAVAKYLKAAFDSIVKAYKESDLGSDRGSAQVPGQGMPGRFAQRAAASPALSPETREASGTEYIPIHLMPLAEEAKAWVNENGLDAALVRLLKLRDDAAPTPSPLDFTIGIEIAGRLSAIGRDADAASVVNTMSERATSLGQTISVLAMLNQLTPQGITSYANNIIAEHIDKLPPDQKATIEEAISDTEKAKEAYAAETVNASNDAILNTESGGEKINTKLKRRIPDAKQQGAVKTGIRGILGQGKTKAEAVAEVSSLLQENGISKGEADAWANAIVGKVYGVLDNARKQLAKDMAKKHSWRVRGHKTLLQKFMGGEMSNEDFIANITAMAGLPSVSRADAAKWASKLDQFKAATDEDVKMVLMGQIFEDIHSILPPEFWGQVRALSYLAMLFYPLTWVKNIGGNTIQWIAGAGRDSIVNGVDAAVGAVTGKRSSGRVKAATRIKTLATPIYDIKRGWQWNAQQYPGASRIQNLKAGLEHLRILSKLTTQNKWDITDAKEAGRRMFSSKFMRGWEASLSIALGAADRAFWMSAFRASLEQRQRAAEANNEWTGRPTPEDIEGAYADAARAIFQDKNPVSQGLTKVRSGINWLSTLGATDQFGLGTALLAFTQVPGSILVRGAFDWSPLGFINAFLFKAARPIIFKASGGRIGGSFDQRAFTTAFSEALLGTTGLVGMGFWLASMGMLTASGDDDEDVTAAMRAQRLGNYKINLSAMKRFIMGDFNRQEFQDGDLLWSYDWAQPLAIAVAGGAEMATQIERDRRKGIKTGITDLSAKSTFVGAIKSLEDQPLLSGLSSFAKTWGYSGPADAVVKTVLGIPSMFVPQAVRRAAQYMDNTVRETRAGDIYTRPFLQIAAGVPGLSDNFPARIDVTGQAAERFPDGGNTLFNLLLNPITISRVKTNPVLQEATRLLNATGDPNAFPRQAGRTVEVKGQKLELTNEQITRHNFYLGNMTMGMLSYRMQTAKYQRASDDEKAKLFVKDLNDVAAATRAGLYGIPPRDLSPAQRYILREFMKSPIARSEPPAQATPPQ
jgi:hypothetical protein